MSDQAKAEATPSVLSMPDSLLGFDRDPHLLNAVLAEMGDIEVLKTAEGVGLSLPYSDKFRWRDLLADFLIQAPDSDELTLALLTDVYFRGRSTLEKRETATYQELKSQVFDRNGVVLREGSLELPSKKENMPAPTFKPKRDPQKVFLVHGRDTRPYVVLEQFLAFIDLKVITWSEASSLTGKAQPTTYEVVRAGIDAAAATIVIWSPDDLANLKPELGSDDDSKPAGQARQNVILEAGIAYGTAPDRTIFVVSEAVRMPSDIVGFNWVKLAGDWDSRKTLISRLKLAGAAAQPRDENLMTRLAGPFSI